VHFLHARTRRDDERGAVLILGALFAAVAIVAAALSVDIGSLVMRKRTNQRVADLASLDGVRGLTAATEQRKSIEQLAVASAARNGFTTAWTANACPLGGTAAKFFGSDPSSWLTVEVGTETTGTTGGFAPQPCPISYDAESFIASTLGSTVNAVRVVVSSPVAFDFMPGGGRETATGVSTLEVYPGTPPTNPTPGTSGSNKAKVRIGSTAVSINATQASLLNTIFSTTGNPTGTPLGNPPGNLAITALGYQGLATTTISLEELATELGINAGTVDQVMTADFGYDQLLTAAATILDRNNQDQASVTVAEIYSRTIGLDFDARHQDIDLSQFVDGVSGNVTTFDGSSIAQTQVNVLQLLQGAAMVADGDHLATIPLTGTVPLPTGATVANAQVQIIEAAQESPYAAATQSADTAQLRVALTLRIPVSVAGLGVLNVDLPVNIEGGGAIATMSDIACQAAAVVPDYVRVSGATRPLSAQTGGWSVSALAGVVTISANPGSVVTSTGSSGGPWDVPPTFTDVHSVTPAALPGLTLSSSAITVGGVLPLGVTAGTVTNAIATTVNPVLAQLGSTIMPSLYQALGVGYGSADISVFDANTATPPVCVPGTPGTSGTSGTDPSYGDLPVLTE
jgi:uncharacterized membrane protein